MALQLDNCSNLMLPIPDLLHQGERFAIKPSGSQINLRVWQRLMLMVDHGSCMSGLLMGLQGL